MTTLQPSNTYQTAARALNTSTNLPLHERIFRDALKDARNRAVTGSDPKLLAKLSVIRDEASMKATIQQELGKGAIGPKAAQRVSRRVAKFCEKVDRLGDLALRISEAHQEIAKPVVGVICFFMTVAGEIRHIDNLIQDVHDQTVRYIKAFGPYYKSGDELSEPLRDSLKTFYSVIITFSSTVIPWFKHSSRKMYSKILLDDPKGRLQALLQDLRQTASEVHQTANAETWVNVKVMGHALAQPPVMPPGPDPSAQPNVRSVAFPMMLSRHFTGRQAELDRIAQLFRNSPVDRPGEVAVFGMPGLGKSQLALAYAQRHSVSNLVGLKYTQRIFIRAKHKAQIQSEVRRVLVGLGLSKDALISTMDYSLMVEKLKSFLRATDRWLLIFDNVTDNNDLIEVRPQEGRGHVVYTTRNENTAELICGADNFFELEPISNHDGARLTKSWMGSSLPQNAEGDAQALQVSYFARGLPLVIEQVAHYARSENVSLDQALDVMRQKQKLLRQSRIDSFHEDNLTVGAILIATFEALNKRLAMAGALFQVLSYLEASSISISMLQEGAREMETYLNRTGTYDRGAIRTHQGQMYHRQQTKRRKFDLFDYNGPFDARLYNRLLRRGEFAKHRQPRLPRVDSESDIEMQSYWQSDSKLQRVFDNQNQLITTINEIQSSGLVRKVDNDTLWMHDLFAELMTAYTAAMETKAHSQAKAQTAATLVWLAFPITQKQLLAWKKSSEYLPHAQSCLKHLEEHGSLLMDANVGAELSHVVASTLCWRMGTSGGQVRPGSADELRKADWEMALCYYKNALRGYIAAQKRLMVIPDMRGWRGMRRVRQATMLELQEEIECQQKGKGAIRYDPGRWMYQTERFGSNSLWRALQTLGRIADVLEKLERYDEAAWYLKHAEKWAEILWHGAELGTEELKSISAWSLCLSPKKGDWETALTLAKEALQRIDPSWELQIAAQTLDIGRILFKLQRGVEGIGYLKSAARKAQGFYGRHHYDVWGFYMALIEGYEELGDWEASLQCWLDALGTLLLDKTGDEGSNYGVFRMETLIRGIEKARAKCEGNTALDEGLKEQLGVAEKAVTFYKGTVQVGRKFRLLQDGMIGWELTEEMREWYRIGKQREWI